MGKGCADWGADKNVVVVCVCVRDREGVRDVLQGSVGEDSV